MGSRVQCNMYRSSMVADQNSGFQIKVLRWRSWCPLFREFIGRRYVTKRDLVKYGHDDECQACTHLAANMHNAEVPDDDRCLGRIGELTAEDGGQRHREQLSSGAVPEAEVQRPQVGQELDVSEPTVRGDVPPVQPVPTYQEGGSSGSASRANEMNTDERDSKRLKFGGSRGQTRQGEDVEELEASAEEQHLDADVGVRAHKTWRVEDVAGDAPEETQQEETSMNRFASSKIEVLEKTDESHRQCKGVGDLNDDEIMELCTHSNEWNACDTTALLNPSMFVPHAAGSALREGPEEI